MNSRKKLLWLVSWYPNKLAPFEGDFIQRHARAVALLHDVEVIFVKKDDEGLVTKNFQEDVNFSTPGLTERIIYYNPVRTILGPLNKILSETAYKYFYRKAILKDFQRSGKPTLVHVHVALKAGMLALWLKEKYNLPYIVSEHWTGYLPEAKPNVRNDGLIDSSRRRKVLNEAAVVTAVSAELMKAMIKRYGISNSAIVPNAVDTNIFKPINQVENRKTRFIHISSLEDQKDPITMLDAFKILKAKGEDFELIIFGPEKPEIETFVHAAGLKAEVKFKVEVAQDILSKDLQCADALVLFSKYETFGCVVIEANACGVPVILSDLDVFREFILEGENGFFAKGGNAENLALGLQKFIQKKQIFDRMLIAQSTADKFSYQVIAEKFDEVYRSTASEKSQ